MEGEATPYPKPPPGFLTKDDWKDNRKDNRKG